MNERVTLAEKPTGKRAPVNRDTLLRQLDMLLAIPRWPRKRSTTDIAQYLRDQRGHRIHVRSVQRDLLRLETDFGYLCEEDGRSQLWFYPADKKVVDLPAMDAPAALAFLLSREHLEPMLPPATLRLLGPYFGRAEEALREVPGSLARWRERVCVMTRGPHLKSPRIPDAVQAEVYEAVLGGKQLSLEYRARSTKATKQQVVHPLGLIVYEGMVYLVANATKYKDPVTYTLHRVKTAKRLEDNAARPAGFKLADWARKTMRFPVSDATLRLVARFDPAVATHLEERPLSADQTATPADGYVEIAATVADTEDLRWWLLGFGELVEVMKPRELRAQVAARIAKATQQYGEAKPRG